MLFSVIVLAISTQPTQRICPEGVTKAKEQYVPFEQQEPEETAAA